MRTVAPPDQARIARLLAREGDRFAREDPRSVALCGRAREPLLAGMLLSWPTFRPRAGSSTYGYGRFQFPNS